MSNIGFTSDLPVPVAPTIVIRGLRGVWAMLYLLNALANRNMHSTRWLKGSRMTEWPKMLVSVERGGAFPLQR